MKKKLLVFLFFFLFITFCQGQVFDLSVIIENIDKTKGGSIKVGMFNSSETYKSKTQAVFETVLFSKDSVACFTFKDIPSGLYSVAMFHDENGDEKLNTKKLGIPAEGVGFSGNLKSKLKPPDFNEASFYLSNDTTIRLLMRYPKQVKQTN